MERVSLLVLAACRGGLISSPKPRLRDRDRCENVYKCGNLVNQVPWHLIKLFKGAETRIEKSCSARLY